MLLVRHYSDLLFKFFCCAALLFCLPAFGQNLVPNPGFEDLNNCPTGLDQIDNANGWFAAGTGIPDLFNSCAAGNDADVPSNIQGSQTPHGGDGYAGIFVFGDDDYREYLSIELNEALTLGSTYCVEYWVSLGDFYASGIQDLGFFFSENEIISTSNGPLNAVPQFVYSNGSIEEATDWISISSQFIADGEHNYLTIGNFFDNDNTVGGNFTPGTNFAEEVYYYIDDVSVVEQGSALSYEITGSDCADGTITLTAAGGSGAFTWFNLENPDTPLSFESELTISVFSTTTLLLTSDSGSCELTETIVLEPTSNPVANIQVNNPCGGFPTEILAQVSNITTDATYQWVITEAGGGPSVFESDNVGSISTILPVGSYIATLVVENNNGCNDDVSSSFNVSAECDDCSDYINLVPNSGFESLSNCPESLGEIASANNWENATSATPDYFNNCATSMSGASVPDNDFGFQNAASGNAYAGLLAFSEQDYREYITIALPAATEAGKTYCLSYEASLGEESSLAVNNLGAVLSPGPISILGSGFTTNLPFSPQIENTEIIDDSDNWTTVTGTFEATGAFNQLTLGNFRNNGGTSGQILDNTGGLFAFYYIDNVELYEVPNLTINAPNGSCLGVNISAVASADFCEYNWFEINNPNDILSTDSSFEIPTNSAGSNQYVVNARYGNCIIADTLNFEVFPLPNASFTSPGGCVGELTPLIVPSPANGTNSYDWDVDGDGDIDISSDNSTGFVFEEAGTYQVSVLVQSETGCVNGNSITVVIEEECPDCSSNSLIINGSFETLTDCPDSFGQIQNASAWISTASDDADLFATCAGNGTNVGVPTNAFGIQSPPDGSENYAGITVYGPDDKRSYLTIPLLSALEVGQTYCASFDVSLAEMSGIALDEIALFFSDNVPNNILGSTPQISSGNDEILDEKNGWTTISGSFTATSDFEFVTIGNFADNDGTNTYIQPQGTMSDVAYYFLDNIRLITTEIELPETVVICQGESAELLVSSDFCEHEWTSFDDPDTVISTSSTTSVNPSSTTSYRYRGINGACSAEATVEVMVIPAPSAGEDRNLCPGETLTIAINGIDNATEIVWSPNNGIDQVDPANPIFLPTETTTYTVSVTYPEASNCPTTDEITITVIEDFAEVSEVMAICTDDGSTQLFASGGDEYSWTPTTGLDDPMSSSPMASPASTTTYTATVTNSETGCSDQATVTVDVFECDEAGPIWLDALGDTTDTYIFDTLVINTTDTTYLPSFFDPDLPQDVVTLSFDGPNNGIFEFLVDSSFYSPEINFFGNDTLNMVACDSLFPVQCDTTILVWTVLPPPNLPPNIVGAGPLQLEAYDNTTTLICPPITDPDGDSFTLSYELQTLTGEVEIVNDTCLSYTGPANFIGEENFVVTACDDSGACTDIDVELNVLDSSLIANDDFVNVIKNDPVNIVVLNNDSIPNSGYDELFVLIEPDHGTTEATDTSFFYFPDLNYIGPDTFQYVLCGSAWGCDTALVHIQVINALEGIDDNFYGAPDEGHEIEVLTNDFIPFGDCVTINIVEPPMNGMIDEVILTIFYEPDPGFVGNDSFVYEVCCPGFGCDLATVNIIITTLLPPIAEDDIINIGADTDISIEVLGNDSDPNGESLSAEILTPPVNGSAELNGNNIVYSPNPGFMGTDSLWYQACNQSNLCNEAWVYLGVGDTSEQCDLWFPEGFSPNGDGINERFYISGLSDCMDYRSNEFKVFNRWGNIVFEAEDYGSGEWWTGDFERTGKPVPAGTYFYILKKPNAPRNENFHGAIEVFR